MPPLRFVDALSAFDGINWKEKYRLIVEICSSSANHYWYKDALQHAIANSNVILQIEGGCEFKAKSFDWDNISDDFKEMIRLHQPPIVHFPTYMCIEDGKEVTNSDGTLNRLEVTEDAGSEFMLSQRILRWIKTLCMDQNLLCNLNQVPAIGQSSFVKFLDNYAKDGKRKIVILEIYSRTAHNWKELGFELSMRNRIVQQLSSDTVRQLDFHSFNTDKPRVNKIVTELLRPSIRSLPTYICFIEGEEINNGMSRLELGRKPSNHLELSQTINKWIASSLGYGV